MINDYAPFIRAWRDRLGWEQESLKKLLASALENAKRVTQILITEYGASQVYLFGSVVQQENFSFRSDIDLAVTD